MINYKVQRRPDFFESHIIFETSNPKELELFLNRLENSSLGKEFLDSLFILKEEFRLVQTTPIKAFK